MLSQTSEYALRVMVWLASQSLKDSHFYLSKILQILTRAFLLQKKRGIKGAIV